MTLMQQLGYTFQNEGLLRQALTHPSFFEGEKKCELENNQRLEFLGDALLDVIIGEALYLRMPDKREGVLTHLRAQIVCEASLAVLARKLEIGKHVKLSNGELQNNGREKPSILADAMEAVIGAIYLDAGWEKTKEVVLHHFDDLINKAMQGHLTEDYKSLFQEKMQEHGTVSIVYAKESESGPEHDKTFHCTVSVNGEIKGRGQGKTIKEAEQNAAKAAMMR